jgi:hypothetical protein
MAERRYDIETFFYTSGHEDLNIYVHPADLGAILEAMRNSGERPRGRTTITEIDLNTGLGIRYTMVFPISGYCIYVVEDNMLPPDIHLE